MVEIWSWAEWVPWHFVWKCFIKYETLSSLWSRSAIIIINGAFFTRPIQYLKKKCLPGVHDWIVSSPRKPSQDNKHNSHEIRNKARWNCKAIILQQANPKSTWEKEKWDWWKLFPLCFYFPMSKCISLTPRKGVKEKTSWPLTIRGRKGRNSLEMRGLRAFIVHCQFISHTASPLFANFKPTSSSLWLLPLTLFAFQLIIITIGFHYRSFCVASQRKS